MLRRSILRRYGEPDRAPSRTSETHAHRGDGVPYSSGNPANSFVAVFLSLLGSSMAHLACTTQRRDDCRPDPAACPSFQAHPCFYFRRSAKPHVDHSFLLPPNGRADRHYSESCFVP